MSPTRELALQIAAEAQLLVKKIDPKLEVHTAFGGTAKNSILNKFKRGDPKILIATPGRLKDYLSEEDVVARFKAVRTVVLDEADRMLDQGIQLAARARDDVTKLYRLPPRYSQNPQGLAFKASCELARNVLFRHYPSADAAGPFERPQAKPCPNINDRCFRTAHTG